MKKLLFLSLLFNAVLLFSFTSFDKNIKSESNNPSEARLEISNSLDFSDCKALCGASNPNSFEVGSECYECLVDNFEANDHQFPEVGGEALKGFNIDAMEIKEIYEGINDFKKAKVHVMMGLMKDNSNPHAIFVVKEGEEFTFYDFTNPCPTYCPDL